MGTAPDPDVQQLLDGLDIDAPLVGIIMGSQSDENVMHSTAP